MTFLLLLIFLVKVKNLKLNTTLTDYHTAPFVEIPKLTPDEP